MTDPKELNTIDKLFRDTFRSLPDSPAPDGWDTPSEQVWMRIRRERGFSPAATGNNSKWMLAALTVGFVVAGMYLFRSSGSDAPGTNNNTGETPASTPIVAAEPDTQKDITVEVPSAERSTSVLAIEKNNTSSTPSSNQLTGEDMATNRMKGAAPLPGTAKPAAPNTTEERKAALEQLWRTPLEMLPVPRR
jgi:hypothetical protein